MDLISRQAAYDTLTAYYHHATDAQHAALHEALNRVPTARAPMGSMSITEGSGTGTAQPAELSTRKEQTSVRPADGICEVITNDYYSGTF